MNYIENEHFANLVDAQWRHHNMINVKPYERSDNGILFTAEWAILETIFQAEEPEWMQAWWQQLMDDHTVDLREYWQAPWKIGEDPASHDNDTGMLSLAFALGITSAPVLFEIAGKYWHPREIIFYNYIKGWSEVKYKGDFYITFIGILRLMATYPFWWLMLPIMAQSCWKRYKVRPQPLDRVKHFLKNGEWPGLNKMVHTDGKLLTFVRCQCLRHRSWLMDVTFKICTRILKRHRSVPDPRAAAGYTNISTWEKNFEYYFPFHDHPTVVYSKQFHQIDYSRTPRWSTK